MKLPGAVLSRVRVKVIASPSTARALLTVTVATSLSVRVRWVPLTVRPLALPDTLMVSLLSISVSSTGVRVKGVLPLLAPALIDGEARHRGVVRPLGGAVAASPTLTVTGVSVS